MDFIQRLFIHKTQNSYVQLFRYGFVSVVAASVNLGGLVILKQYAHVDYLLAATLSFVVGLITNYILSALWVFHSSKLDKRSHELLLFTLIGLVGLGLNDLILWTLTSGFGLFYVLSWIVATAIVYFWNFGIRKKFVFN